MPITLPETEEFDPRALATMLDGPYGPVRQQLRDILSREEFAPVHALPTDEYRARVMEWMEAIAREGQTAPGFPEKYGGLDDPGANVAAFETIGFSDLSLLVKFGVHFGLWGGAVLQLGTEPHHERYLRKTAELKLLGCFAMTEAGHGSDVQNLETTATYDAEHGEFVINTPTDSAHKEYIGNAACHGRMAAVFAQLIVDGERHGVHAFAVEIRDEQGNVREGVRIEDSGEKMGLNGVDNGRIWFDDMRVPRDALLNRYGDVNEDGVYSSPIEKSSKRFFTMLSALVQGRVCISGASISATKSALTIAVRYGLRRRQFGPSPDDEVLVMDYRTHQRRLLPLLAKTYALHFAQDVLRSRYHEVFSGGEASERDRRELETLAAGMKATASWHATAAIQTARECCGGAGYMSVNRFAALKADTDVFTTFEGDNTVLMMLVAKGVLTDYRDYFSDLNPRETVTFVAEQAVETIVERLFARKIIQVIGDAVTGDDEGTLSDREYLLDLFRWREGHITASIAQRFRRGLSEDHDPFEVFRAVQHHAANAARAHMATVLLEAFNDAVERCEDEALKATLDRLCQLYALSDIEDDRGFYQEHGRLTGPRCKAITREVNRLCNEVRTQASGLVDAFAIPDSMLGAPIGLSQDSSVAAAGD